MFFSWDRKCISDAERDREKTCDFDYKLLKYIPLSTYIKPERHKYFRQEFICNNESTVPKKLEKNSSIYTEMNIYIKYSYFLDENIPTNSYYILREIEINNIDENTSMNINKTVDEIWLYNSFYSRYYSELGIDDTKIKIIPIGINREIYRKVEGILEIEKNTNFKYLYVGNIALDKGLGILLDSYENEFIHEDWITLIIYDDGTSDIESKNILKETLRKRVCKSEIIFYDDYLPEKDIAKLYSTCDCFVYVHKIYYIGLNVLKAMSCELPIITLKQSFSLELPTNNFFVDSEVAYDDNGKESYLVSTNSLKIKLREVYDKSYELENIGILNKDFIINNHDWYKIFERIDLSLKSIKEKYILRYKISKVIDELEFEVKKSINSLDYEGINSSLYKLSMLKKLGDTYLYYLGLSYFHLNNYERAIDVFANCLELGVCTYDLCHYLGKSSRGNRWFRNSWRIL